MFNHQLTATENLPAVNGELWHIRNCDVQFWCGCALHIYNATGVLLRSVEVSQGTTHIDGLPLGIYLVNGVKVIVR